MRTTTDNVGTTTSNVTVTDYETVNLNVGSYTTGVNQDLGVVNVGSANTLNVTGSNDLTIAAGFVGKTLDASGMSGLGNIVMSGAATTVTSIIGSGSHDTIVGDSSGNLSGGAGNDNITGGTGNDTIDGGTGNDTIAGGTGSNVITGGEGNDSITASTGADTIDGGAGNDIVIIAGGNIGSTDSISGGDGTDTLQLSTAAVSSVLGGQKIFGFETLQFTTTGLTQDMAFFANTTFTSVQAVGVAALTITNGSSSLNTFFVENANTTLSFARASDTTSDSLTLKTTENASVGTSITANDEETITIDSDLGTFTTADLQSTDLTTFIVNGDNNVTITDSTTVTNLTTVTVNLTGTSTFTALFDNSTKAMTFTAPGSTTGTMTITTGSGADVVTAGSGILSATTGTGADSITGGALNDTLNGGNSNDTISGGAGADNITGGNGADSLTGGDGADTFDFDNVSEAGDTITDFQAGTTNDVMDFTAITALTVAYEEIANDTADITANSNFIVIGGATDITTAAALIAADTTVLATVGYIIISDGTNTQVYHTTDLAGNGTETLMVTLTGISNPLSLSASNFDA
jgi:Ca2+-binding RTX toxin-like protein